MSFMGTFILISIPVLIVNLFVGEFLSRNIVIGMVTASAAIVSVGLLEILRGPRLKEIELPVKGLPPTLNGLRIVQVSDLHVGPTIRRAFVREVVERCNDLSADLVLVTGDIADARASSIVEDLAPLAELKAKHGVFYVTGNHEYYWDVDGLVKLATSLGLQALMNENRVVKVGDAKILVAGITDPMGFMAGGRHRPDLARALTQAESTDFKILLSHRPDPFAEAEKAGVDLQFSGHTHGGQFFPFSLLIPLAHKHYRGLSRHGSLWIYVNPGTGYWGPPNRFGVPPEITLLSLVQSE
jgi:predicted MPP superfamily phosphohydrolase